MSFLIFVLFLVEFVMQGVADGVSSRLSLTLNTKDNITATSREVIDSLEAFKQIDPSIEVAFTSASQNLETLRKRDPELAKIVETDEENPLPGTISIKNVPIEKYEALDQAILERTSAFDFNEEKHRKSVIGYKNQYDRLRTVVEVLHSLRYGLYGVIGFFLFSVFVVIFHSIGNAVFFFREEIRITELVG
jgi:cell division protein FtsX